MHKLINHIIGMILFQLFNLGNLEDIVSMVLVLCMYSKLSLSLSGLDSSLRSGVRFIQVSVRL